MCVCLSIYTCNLINVNSIPPPPLPPQGGADPTDQLPPGTIFIPGYVGNMHGARELFGARYPRIFLSRSPALVPSDAKLLEVVHKKPSSMTKENWNFLCSFRFGTVVFSAPLNGMPPLPCQVGEGDLDGDLVRFTHVLLYLLGTSFHLFSLTALPHSLDPGLQFISICVYLLR